MIVFTAIVVWMELYILLIANFLILDYFVLRYFGWGKVDRVIVRIRESNIFIRMSIFLVALVVFTMLSKTLFFDMYVVTTSYNQSSLMKGDRVFVDKLSFGPRMPITHIAIPFLHSTIPFTNKKSFIQIDKKYNFEKDYKRLKGISNISNNDIIVYNHPFADTVCKNMRYKNYIDLVKKYGKRQIQSKIDLFGKIDIMPVDKINYAFSRCVGLPGDRVEITASKLFVNDFEIENRNTATYNYLVRLKQGTLLNPEMLRKLNITENEVKKELKDVYNIKMTIESAKKLIGMSFVSDVKRRIKIFEEGEREAYPRGLKKLWNSDHMGPLFVPQKGDEIELNLKTLPYYRAIIEKFESNKVFVKGDGVYVNSKRRESYTIQKDYYFVVNDNRTVIDDSRRWGFIPEDYIIGVAKFVVYSKDEDGFNLNRIFKNL